MPAKRSHPEAPESPVSKKPKAGPPSTSSPSDLSRAELVAVVEQLLLDPETMQSTRRYIGRARLPREQREDLGLKDRVTSLRTKISDALEEASTEFGHAYKYESADYPETAGALAPIIPLVVALAVDPPHWETAPAEAYDLLFNMLRTVSEESTFTSDNDDGFNGDIQEAMMQVLRLREEREGLSWVEFDRADLFKLGGAWTQREYGICIADVIGLMDEMLEREREEDEQSDEEKDEDEGVSQDDEDSMSGEDGSPGGES